MSIPSSDESGTRVEPRKAYAVKVRGYYDKTLLIYANSVEEADAIARDDRHGLEVIAEDIGEIGPQRARRLPEEDR